MVCIVHCLLTPLLVILVPFVGESLAHSWFHVLIALLVVPVAIWALWTGYRRHHQARVLGLGAIGLAFIAAAFFTHDHRLEREYLFMVMAGVFLAAAHYSNLRVCRQALAERRVRPAPPHDHSSCARASHKEHGS
ncbi:MAG: MerC domain-containing protein [Bdellovibrionales bacterium]